MSYDFAVWQGDAPADNAAAAATFARLSAIAHGTPPAPAIAKFVAALLAKWPDLEDDDDSPWADSPLIGNASGSMIYLASVPSRADEVAEVVAALAAKHQLVAFDPQTSALLAPGKRADAEPRVTLAQGEKQFVAGLAPVLARHGFTLDRRRVASRVQGEVIQRVTFARANSRSVGLAIAIEHPTVSAQLQAERGAPSPVALLAIGLHQNWFARFYAVREGLRDADILDLHNAAAAHDFDFKYDLCHASCVARAVGGATHALETFAMPFFDRMQTLAAIAAWWSTGWTPRSGDGRKFDPRRDDFRWMASSVPAAALEAALAAAASVSAPPRGRSGSDRRRRSR